MSVKNNYEMLPNLFWASMISEQMMASRFSFYHCGRLVDLTWKIRMSPGNSDLNPNLGSVLCS